MSETQTRTLEEYLASKPGFYVEELWRTEVAKLALRKVHFEKFLTPEQIAEGLEALKA